MIVKQYIKDFEAMGFGMFVHFGAYSVLGKGEWAKYLLGVSDEAYKVYTEQFDPKPDWAPELVKIAKDAGCKYITLTTRHHDGFSLYDTCGLSDYSVMHTKCGRDLVREFVDACRAEGIVPFFYHTLLDWHHPDYKANFPEYLKYLRASVEILCKNYGKIGGLWFDGMWDKAKEEDDWEEDALYGTIRKYQPEAMIINNTGTVNLGALGHIELDSVTFERGKPQPINMEGAPKYVASEMCEVFADHWGYAREDLNFKSAASMIQELVSCRRYGANMLLNIGPMEDGSVRPMDAAMLGVIGQWVRYFDEAIRKPRPTQIEVENKPYDFLLKNGKTYYFFCCDLNMAMVDPNVIVSDTGAVECMERFSLPEKLKSAVWMDDNSPLEYTQTGDVVECRVRMFDYGRHLVVRVAKLECE